MSSRDIVVIGSSLGGIEALSQLVSDLPIDFPAAVFIVQHVASNSPRLLAPILGRRSLLPTVTAEDGMNVEAGRIVVAPPGRHMILTRDGVRVIFGPRENRSRPAIDPLFRNAAVHYRSRVIGVILTGLLADGTAGLLAVKRCGGIAVVQMTSDAAFPEMPRNALATVDVDHQVALADLASLLSDLTTQTPPEPPPVPKELLIEARLTERTMTSTNYGDVSSRPAPFSCPDCGGNLLEIKDETLRRYRCHVGHSFTGEMVVNGQDDGVEAALWMAIRTLDERARMLEIMARDERERGREMTAREYDARAAESRTHERRVREVLAKLAPGDHPHSAID